jgi:LuxR family maltose regulon positive regulatory protein
VLVQRIKLRPPQVHDYCIPRPDLENCLHPPIYVVSVTGGPGYGKTVVAARLYDAWHSAKLWYSLDADDADLAVFAAHLDAGLRGMGAVLPDFEPSQAISPSAPKEIASSMAQALSALEAPLLVLDDLHVLEGSRSLATLGELVTRATRCGVRFVLSGRTVPIPLHTLAAAGRLLSLTPAQLAFDSGEVRRYLDRALPGVDSGSMMRFLEPAEGWPAGIALLVSSLRTARQPLPSSVGRAAGGVQPGMPAASEGGEEARRHLFAYLASEVLASLPDRERNFLLDTAIVDRLEVGLCNAVCEAEDAGELLESLAARGLFVTRQAEDVYRCHQLFKEFLAHELERRRDGDYIRHLRRRAARYLELHGEVLAAAGHYVAAGEPDAAADLLEGQALALVSAGFITALGGTLGRLDQGRIARSPVLSVALGRVYRERGDWDAALAVLEGALTTARAAGRHEALAEAVRACAPILAARGEFERLRRMLDEALSSAFDIPEASVTSLRMTLAAVHLEMNRLDEALAIYHAITPSVVARGDRAAHGLILHNTGVAHMRRGEVYTGLSLYERALKVKEVAGLRVSRLVTLGDLIYAKTLLGDLEVAERLANEMLSQALDVGVTSLVSRAYEQLGVLALLRDDTSRARRAFLDAREVCDPGDLLLLPDIEHGLAQCALRNGGTEEADELCARAGEAYRRSGRDQQLSAVLVTRSQAALAAGDAVAASHWAGQALSCAGRGLNALLEATTSLDAALLLTRCAAKLTGDAAVRADRQAAAAATAAVALMHQRDYRFLLRTKAAVWSALAPHLRGWGIGAAILPDIDSQPAAHSMHIEMLGRLRVSVNGREVPPEAWKRRRALDIFALLVSQRGRPVSRARLVDMFWPESDADAAHDSLRVTITAIRKAVGDVVRYEANAYRFDAPPGTTVDCELFDRYIEAAQQAEALGDRVAARHSFEAAVALYQGDFLEGLHEGGWQWKERERLRAGCLEALRWLAADCAAAGDAPGQRRWVERLLEVAPFDVEAVRLRLEALCLEKRTAEARRDYEEWRARYRAAVGAEAPHLWQPPAAPDSDKESVQGARVGRPT